jgi:hypothetical protein
MRNLALVAETRSVAGRPPVVPRSAGGLSGRPFCRIYQAAQRWVLEIDPVSGGWLPDARDPAQRRMIFKTLIDAVNYAERHGFDYRVVPPPIGATRATLPRSWLARLARNGRRGDTYHS